VLDAVHIYIFQVSERLHERIQGPDFYSTCAHVQAARGKASVCLSMDTKITISEDLGT
jgi:hypothetical protein